MATYDKLIYDLAPYQEGNKADLEFTLDENFPIDQVSEITMEVRDSSGRLKLSRSMTGGTIILSGATNRDVTITFAALEMKRWPGSYVYEIDFIDLEGESFSTIGGVFKINAEVNKS